MASRASTDIAWAAGIIEGEGYIGRHNKLQPELSVAMTDLDILERLQAIWNMGTINKVPVPDGNKQQYRWRVRRHSHVAGLLMTIYPFLGERRSVRAREALADWQACPGRGRR